MMAINDLIYRAAAIDALGECPYNWNDWPEEIQAVDDWQDAIESIKNVPAVDAAPVVHGRWYDVGSLSCRCSECGCKAAAETRYCPNCGAYMG